MHIEFTLELKALIEQIIKKNGFREDFLFQEYLLWMKDFIEDVKEHEYEQRFIEEKKSLKQEIKLCEKLIETMRRNLNSGKDISAEDMKLLISLEENIERKKNELNKLTKLGRPLDSVSIRTVTALSVIYTHGTSPLGVPLKKPKCYKDEITGKYQGDFYNFMIDMLPVLNLMGISPTAKINSLADYFIKYVPKETNHYRQSTSSIDELIREL